MERCTDEAKKKEFLMKKEGYNVRFTLLDMGSYVGHQHRQWYQKATPHWETMGISVDTEDTSKSLDSEFLIDSNGGFQRLIIEDKNGNKRILLKAREHIDEEGVHKLQNLLVQEMYVEAVPDQLLGKTYYFEEETGKFIDEHGNVAEESILTRQNLGELFMDAGKTVSHSFNKTLREQKDVTKLDDIDFGR